MDALANASRALQGKGNEPIGVPTAEVADPIFRAIEAFKEAERHSADVYDRWNDEGRNGDEPDCDAAAEAHWEALKAMVSTAPATLEGARALLKFATGQ